MPRLEKALYKREPLEIVESGKLFIRTKTGEIKPFVPNFAQKIVLALIKKRLAEGKPVRIRLLKARQLGFSTLFEAIIYCFTSRREGFHSLVIADDEEGSKELFEMNKLYHETLPDIFKTPTKKSNEIALEFEGLKSKIHIDTARNKRAGRGSTFQIVHRSESSRFQFYKDVSLGIANAVADLPGTMIFDESTANGMELWYEDVQKSIRGEDGYDFIFIPWFYDPTYTMVCGPDFELTEQEQDLIRKVKDFYQFDLTNEQINWYRFCLAHKCSGDEKLRCQEYPSFQEEAFIFSGRPRFDVSILRSLKERAIQPIAKDGLLAIYEPYDSLSKYCMGVDTSEGLVKGDSSSVTILDCKKYCVAAHYSGKISPDVLATYLKIWGLRYNEALAIVESNNHGLVTLNYLKDIYKTIYYRKVYDKISDQWLEKIGWQTSARTKPLLISNMDKAIRSGIGIKSMQMIDQLMSYVIEDDGSTNASEGKNDDDVISCALAVQGYLETSEHSLPEPKQPVLEGTVEHIMQMKKEAKKPIHSYSGLKFRT